VYKQKPKKGQPGALKLPHSQGPGRGPTILVYKQKPKHMKKHL